MVRRFPHFASDDKYPKLVRALIPYEKNLVSVSLTQDIMEVVASDVRKGKTTKEFKRKLGCFVRNHRHSILQHIAELKINKDAVVLHKPAKTQNRFFESVVMVMIPHKEFLQTHRWIPNDIMTGMSKQLMEDSRSSRSKGHSSRLASLRLFIQRNRHALLQRIYEIDKVNGKEKLNSSSEGKGTDEKSGPGKNNVSIALLENQEDPESKIKDPKLVSPAKSQSLPSRKRCRGEENDEERSPTTSPCPKRRHLTTDDLAFARWCLQKVCPRF